MATSTRKHPGVRQLTTREARRLFDREARRHLGMTGPEFIRKWEAGKLNGKADTPAVMRVAMLLPFGR